MASGRQKELLRELGADEFIDYTKTNADEIIEDIDLVIDAVGGPGTERFLKTLKSGGSLFPIFPLGFSGHEEAERLGVTVSATQVRSNGRQLSELASLLNQGIIHVVIDSTFSLSQARQSHERAAKGHIQGKIVLTVDQ
ncbi:zinc-binding dehydrogenase [Chryseobacterium sp. SSA4.19]|uniref:zinc-binding dehydrogenase n=1 Tax=Chryseobacterium sp. SSA4.19 TaxID=2919915 RepID=UPI001F4FA323|nr:zinc-binding dehydrogenase [Chryseobacterium sp. SSA4.19]